MCTVSWSSQLDGYTLIFNRDESRSRPVGLPPEIGTSKEVQYICPHDPKCGGTWLLANEFGLSLGLLNYYEAQVNYQPSDPQSRGDLPLKLAHCNNRVQVETELLDLDLSPYPPFHFLVVDRSAKASQLTWDGKETTIAHPTSIDLPITTSSFKTIEVVACRKHLYQDEVVQADDTVSAMAKYHGSKQPTPETHSVLMTRPDAKTVSISTIEVNSGHVKLSYQERPTDTDQLGAVSSQTISHR